MKPQNGLVPTAATTLNRPFDLSTTSIRQQNLDTSAIIYPSVASLNDPQVYRVSCLLHDDVQAADLQQALDDVLPYFPAFTHGISKGLFWRRHSRLARLPQVGPDDSGLLKAFDLDEPDQPLFRVIYDGGSINLEAFHSLTDGIGAIRFLLALAYRYCQLAYADMLHYDHRYQLFGLEHATTLIDGFAYAHLNSQGTPKVKKNKQKRSYQLRGELIGAGLSQIQTETVPVDALKAASRKNGVTLGIYLTAAVAQTIASEFKIPAGDSIGICVPVNLRPIFEVETALNFYSTILLQIPSDCLDSFERTIEEVQRQFQLKSTKEGFQKAISDLVRLQSNRFSQVVPLLIKDPVLRTAYHRIKSQRTTTFSNLGVITAEEPFQPFLKGIRVVGSTSPDEPVRLTACSYDGELALTSVSKIRDESIVARLKTILLADSC